MIKRPAMSGDQYSYTLHHNCGGRLSYHPWAEGYGCSGCSVKWARTVLEGFSAVDMACRFHVEEHVGGEAERLVYVEEEKKRFTRLAPSHTRVLEKDLFKF